MQKSTRSIVVIDARVGTVVGCVAEPRLSPV